MPKAKTKTPAPGPARKPVGRQAARGGMIRARIEPDLKARAEHVLGRLGLKPSEAIRLFYAQIDLAGGIPFPVEIPNAATREAMRAADAGEVTRYASPAELFEKLGI